MSEFVEVGELLYIKNITLSPETGVEYDLGFSSGMFYLRDNGSGGIVIGSADHQHVEILHKSSFISVGSSSEGNYINIYKEVGGIVKIKTTSSNTKIYIKVFNN